MSRSTHPPLSLVCKRFTVTRWLSFHAMLMINQRIRIFEWITMKFDYIQFVFCILHLS